MTLKFEVDSLDVVPEDQHGLYQEADGKFRLAVDGLPKPEDTSGLKSALEKERERAKSAAKWEKLGKSPDEIQALLDAEEERAQNKLKEEGDFKTLLAQHQEKWNGERDVLSGERDAAISALNKHVGESAFVTELAKQGATEEGISALPTLFLKRIGVTVEGDQAKIEIMQADGKTPMAGTSENGTATLGDLVGEAIKKFPSLFKEPGAGGGGKRPDSDGGKPTKKFSDMSSGELVRLRRENPQEYDRLKAENG